MRKEVSHIWGLTSGMNVLPLTLTAEKGEENRGLESSGKIE
jgi:hypothetical protein